MVLEIVEEVSTEETNQRITAAEFERATRKIEHSGICIFKNWYWHNDLLPFFDSEVTVVYQSKNYSCILVELPSHSVVAFSIQICSELSEDSKNELSEAFQKKLRENRKIVDTDKIKKEISEKRKEKTGEIETKLNDPNIIPADEWIASELENINLRAAIKMLASECWEALEFRGLLIALQNPLALEGEKKRLRERWKQIELNIRVVIEQANILEQSEVLSTEEDVERIFEKFCP